MHIEMQFFYSVSFPLVLVEIPNRKYNRRELAIVVWAPPKNIALQIIKLYFLMRQLQIHFLNNKE